MVQEDIYEALVRSQAQFREHRVLTLRYWGTWLVQTTGSTSHISTVSQSYLLSLVLIVGSGSESPMLQYGFLRIIAIFTMHWQRQTTGSQHRVPERSLG